MHTNFYVLNGVSTRQLHASSIVRYMGNKYLAWIFFLFNIRAHQSSTVLKFLSLIFVVEREKVVNGGGIKVPVCIHLQIQIHQILYMDQSC